MWISPPLIGCIHIVDMYIPLIVMGVPEIHVGYPIRVRALLVALTCNPETPIRTDGPWFQQLNTGRLTPALSDGVLYIKSICIQSNIGILDVPNGAALVPGQLLTMTLHVNVCVHWLKCVIIHAISALIPHHHVGV